MQFDENHSKSKTQLEFLKNMGDVNGGIAHEINNPMAVIMGQISIIQSFAKKDKLTKEVLNDKLERVINSCKKLNSLIKEMSNLPRSFQEDKTESIELLSIVNTIKFLNNYLCKKHHVTLEINLHDEDVQINFIKSQIVLAFHNIISCFINHCKTLDETRQISITSSDKQDHLELIFSINDSVDILQSNMIIAKDLIESNKGSVELMNEDHLTQVIILLKR